MKNKPSSHCLVAEVLVRHLLVKHPEYKLLTITLHAPGVTSFFSARRHLLSSKISSVCIQPVIIGQKQH